MVKDLGIINSIFVMEALKLLAYCYLTVGDFSPHFHTILVLFHDGTSTVNTRANHIRREAQAK